MVVEITRYSPPLINNKRRLYADLKTSMDCTSLASPSARSNTLFELLLDVVLTPRMTAAFVGVHNDCGFQRGFTLSARLQLINEAKEVRIFDMIV